MYVFGRLVGLFGRLTCLAQALLFIVQTCDKHYYLRIINY